MPELAPVTSAFCPTSSFGTGRRAVSSRPAALLIVAVTASLLFSRVARWAFPPSWRPGRAPSGAGRGAAAPPGVAVEVLVEQHEVPEMGIVVQLGMVGQDRRSPRAAPW